MADTFEQVWRRVMLHCPLATPFLAKNWVQTVYNRITDRKPWSFLRSESQILITDAHTGTVNATYLDPVVQGVGMTFVAADVGRQFRVSYGPPYTIISVNVGLNRATLDLPWGDDSITAESGTVLDAYVTMPDDFGTFIAVLDPQNQWQLHTWITQDELNLWDAGRSSTGTPWALASRRLSSGIAATLGRVQYELWPYSTTQKRYPYYYYKSAANLADTDQFYGALRDRTDVLLTGALAEAAQWPGPSAEKKNPYFNLQTAAMLKKEHEEQCNSLETKDEETYITWLETVNFNRVPFAPIDSNFLQSHDVSLVGSPGGFGW